MNNGEIVLPVLKIQRFSVNDGAGIRTTVFLKGCPLRCKWCHNPESQSVEPEFFYTPSLCINCRKCERVCEQRVHSFVLGKHTILREKCIGCMKCCDGCVTGALEKTFIYYTTDEIIEEVLKDKVFYGKIGGLTVSGGEPMFHGEKTIELLRKAKKAGLNVCLETCGYYPTELTNKLCDVVDCFLWDVKDTVPERHKEYTGVDNDLIIKNLYLTDELGGKTVIRCIMVNDVNTDDFHLEGIAKLYKKLRNCYRVEIFSYRDYGVGKYNSLGKTCESNLKWIVPFEKLKRIQKHLTSLSVKCIITGT